jgi:hypothetical protein
VEPRGELSSFYDEHSRFVRVHDPVRTVFNFSDARPAAGRSLSDNNRVVIAAADVRKSPEPDESSTCTPATAILEVAESRTSPTSRRSPCTRNGRPRGFASQTPSWGSAWSHPANSKPQEPPWSIQACPDDQRGDVPRLSPRDLFRTPRPPLSWRSGPRNRQGPACQFAAFRAWPARRKARRPRRSPPA